jgi:hypothetical protein
MRFGPWGSEHAPDPAATFTFAHAKSRGVSPGMTVKDPSGREWSVKFGDEGHVEVLLSRVLSALGYHQPPVYYLRSFTLHDDRGTHPNFPGARFRPKLKELDDRGEWSWQQNPFVGTRPYQGLLVTLLLFDSSDLKNSNNSLYEYVEPGAKMRHRMYVVRDLGTALGETGKLDPKRNDPQLLEQNRFIKGVDKGFIEFGYHGWHQELVTRRVTPDEVKWACELAARLTDRQWDDAFATAGYDEATGRRFTSILKARIERGRHIE